MAKKKAQAQQKTQPKAQSKTQSSPKDISLRLPKLIKKSGLDVTELERNQIYLIHNFFTPKECEALIQHFDACLTPQPVPAIPKPGEAFRSNDRQSIQDSAFADLLWQLGMSEVCQQTPGIADVSLPRKPVGLNSNIRVYRYRTGQRFEGHYDDAVQDKERGLWTDWTLLIYLNGDMQGGETVFYKTVTKKRTSDPISVRPETGLALLHRHGKSCMFHEALEVTRGNKWVLRSDVLVG
ncbi:hypothetical protein BCR43DRAFT_484919 [Syncephalastrum racemosum]|uniref:Fe2OG dioxygenase domain-containing protein n=1 Tax=Syncephalastrum racemosum TaxID=13706 RepID=A0A1X2HLH5_SYNRA|nr:hypothetical protein BCR43DRAFT_484919 [Syncephalastrum racemosum]